MEICLRQDHVSVHVCVCVCACMCSVCFCVHVQTQLHTIDVTNLVEVGRGGEGWRGSES